ncbi:helix-turn-helix transcriptional regulator [Granulicella sp. WH15]|uniref:helix-turn-helix domain-containing protein n=1 Tax=Granulicella sp. WH15 TaxID=2602070 RepID=UPI0013671D45|nr:helix-turn-helix transcriptional regulator [Granulicella sp. WH15]QHN02734.1 helix-turn-helix transcriptional regulator [Granulicella sp. WH15]
MAKRKQIQPRDGVERAFGDEMRKARLKKKISQMTLYKATGLDRTFISDLERGIQGPSLRTVFRVAEGIDIQPQVLLEKTMNSRFFVSPSSDLPQNKMRKQRRKSR